MCGTNINGSGYIRQMSSENPTAIHDKLMERAAEISVSNVKKTLGPFGSVLVKTGTDDIIAAEGNTVTRDNDPTAHSEMNTIRAACRKLGTFDLSGYTLYTSCECCPMCLSAVYWSHIDTVYYSNTQHDAAAIGFDDAFIYNEIAKPMEKRSTTFIHLPNDTAKRAFDMWKQSGDKVEY
jgi:guanine deaminase